MIDLGVSEALEELASDPYDCLEEETNPCDFYADLENVPSYSQKIAMGMLHEDNGQETIDGEHN